jgi:hypothetical protein
MLSQPRPRQVERQAVRVLATVSIGSVGVLVGAILGVASLGYLSAPIAGAWLGAIAGAAACISLSILTAVDPSA